MRSRITIQRIVQTQDDAGGLVPGIAMQWSKWAKVENRRGSDSFTRDQRDWSYDYKIRTRYEKSRPERSGDYVVYDGKLLAIKELVLVNEGAKRFVDYRVTTVDDDYINGLSSLGLFTYIYTGTGGEYAFTASELNGKDIVAASKDGVEYVVYEKAVKATAEDKEVVYENGTLEWSVPFDTGEKAIIHYR